MTNYTSTAKENNPIELENVRDEIDLIDQQLQKLLQKRFELALTLKPYKQKISDPIREEEILSKIHSPYIKDVYQTIFRVSKKMQSEGSDESQS